MRDTIDRRALVALSFGALFMLLAGLLFKGR